MKLFPTMPHYTRLTFIVLLLAFRSAALPAQEKLGAFRPGDLWPDDKGVHINAHGGGMLVMLGSALLLSGCARRRTVSRRG
jgi:hypothetical protein